MSSPTPVKEIPLSRLVRSARQAKRPATRKRAMQKIVARLEPVNIDELVFALRPDGVIDHELFDTAADAYRDHRQPT